MLFNMTYVRYLFKKKNVFERKGLAGNMNGKTIQTWRLFPSNGVRTACWAKKSQTVEADIPLNEGCI